MTSDVVRTCLPTDKGRVDEQETGSTETSREDLDRRTYINTKETIGRHTETCQQREETRNLNRKGETEEGSRRYTSCA